MVRYFALALAFALTLPDAASAQIRRTDLNLALGQLGLAVRTLPPVAAASRIQAAVSWLTDRAAASDPAQVSKEYLRSLEQLGELLRLNRRADVMDDVAAELEAKVEHC